MALKFFAIDTDPPMSTHADRQRELDEQHRIAVDEQWQKLDALLNEGWVVIAFHTMPMLHGSLLKFVLHKADKKPWPN